MLAPGAGRATGAQGQGYARADRASCGRRAQRLLEDENGIEAAVLQAAGA